MSYPSSGHVESGGDWLDRQDGDLHVRKLSVGEMDNNVYVIHCLATGAALLVDAADNAPRLREAIADVDAAAVVQTHGHWDHIRAWKDLVADPGLPVWGHVDDQDLFPATVDRALVDGDELIVGDLRVSVLHIPGHTPGSLMFLVHADERAHLFSGDTLFPGGPGNTWKDAAKFDQLMTGLEDRIFADLPDSTWVYPGHGDDTTLGAERASLPEWRARGW